MLEKLTLQNFQCHDRLEIEFAPGVTTIIGDNDKGKSAILRAIRLVSLNKPQSDGYIRFGAKGCRVFLEVDGKTVARLRGPGTNAYKLEDQEFVSFGSGVPDPVASHLNLNEHNFQRQHDPPFWLTLTSGGLARELNEIVDLEVIDRAIANSTSALRGAVNTAESAQKELTEACEEMEMLEWVPRAEEAFNRLESDHKQLEDVRQRAINLKQTIHVLKRDRWEANNYRQRAEDTARLAEAAKEAGRTAQRISRLSGILGRIEIENGKVKDVPDFTQASELFEAYQKSTKLPKLLKHQLMEIEAAKKVEEEREIEAKEMHKTFHERVGEACPLCGAGMEI